jgi:hypothetical protein
MLLGLSIDILQGKPCHPTDLGVGKTDEHVKYVAKNKRCGKEQDGLITYIWHKI